MADETIAIKESEVLKAPHHVVCGDEFGDVAHVDIEECLVSIDIDYVSVLCVSV